MLRRIVGEGAHRENVDMVRSQIHISNSVKPVSPDPDVVRHQPEANRWFKNCGVDLMITLSLLGLSFEEEFPT